ncbi:hypothetical protein FRC17_001280 [Serendipita sp. 399]|nr:hypothetical protein FRC17_001280 [Serendipita sp. 399]
MSVPNLNRLPTIQGSHLIQPSIDERRRVFATDGRQRDAIAREAAYLLTRYLDSAGSPHERKENPRVEYDPPWMYNEGNEEPEGEDEDRGQSKNTPRKTEVLIELGAGLGYVGLAAAESVHSVLRNRRRRHKDDRHEDQNNKHGHHVPGPDGEPHDNHAGLSSSTNSSAEVILTDLPDVCVLLKENVVLQTTEWANQGLGSIMHDDADPDQQLEARELGSELPLVSIRVRDLAWGNDEHVQNLSKELNHRYKSQGDIQLTILCSDLIVSAVWKRKVPSGGLLEYGSTLNQS